MPNIFACQRFLTCVAPQKPLASEVGHWKKTTDLESKFYYNFYKIDNMVQQPYWMLPLWRKNLQYHTAQHNHTQRLKNMYSFHSLLSITFPPAEWLQGIAQCSGYRVVSLATWNNSIRVISPLSYDTVTGQSSSSSSSFLESTAAAFTARAKSSLLACKRSPGKRMSKHYYFFSSKNS